MVQQKIYWDPWKQDKINSLSYEQDLSMICDILKIFSQNIWKNNLIINTILETQSAFDIMFIQEPP